MKPFSLLLVAVSAVSLTSCVDPYYGGQMPPRPEGPRILEREPIMVERRRYSEERAPVLIERYPDSHREQRPYYGDPAPSTSYRRTTTRTYQDY